jgi:hypothetical protein
MTVLKFSLMIYYYFKHNKKKEKKKEHNNKSIFDFSEICANIYKEIKKDDYIF